MTKTESRNLLPLTQIPLIILFSNVNKYYNIKFIYSQRASFINKDLMNCSNIYNYCCCCCCCECNCIIFPAPTCSYTSKDVNIRYFVNSSQHSVPYVYIPAENPKLNLIYFHGNAEDIGYTRNFLKPLADRINANIYAMEYPSYGLYQSFPIMISNKIKSDSLQFFDFLAKHSSIYSELQVTKQNTIIFGRSIGSGGATYLASRKKLHHLILMSPFTDIPSVASDIIGCLGCLGCLGKVVKCHFNNTDELRNYNGALLVIHGKSDDVIKCYHGQALIQEYIRRNPSRCESVFPKYMTHNQFDYESDIMNPVLKFVKNSFSLPK